MKFRFFNLQLGQSLIELMIGLAVISIALTAVLSLTTKSIQLTEIAELRKQAVNLSRTKIEEIKKARDFETDWVEFTDKAVQAPYTETVPVEAKGATFIVSSAVTIRSATIVDVNVSVTWTDVNGEHVVSDYTVLTKWR